MAGPALQQVDGVLDEPQWSRAALLTGFSQYRPVDGLPAADSTEILVWYAPGAIYFGVRAFEAHGDVVRATLADRDAIDADDNVQILLDTYDDRRRAFEFAVNPLGIQADGVRSEGQDAGAAGGGNAGTGRFDGVIDLNPDFVWESRGHVTPWGYEVEVRIPMKSLRYQSANPQDWGLQIIRQVQHSGYQDTWTPVVRASASFLAQAGRLVGLHDLHRGIVMDVNPEVTTKIEGAPGDSGYVYGTTPEVGGTLHWGLTSNLSLSATAHPDFSQIEADVPHVTVNQRFALYYPEKRTFFLEGADIFDFGLGLQESLIPFFSRSLGLVEDSLGDNQQVPIDVGAKVNGRINRTNFGALAVRTGAIEGLPTANTMAVVRVKQNVLRESSVGFIATAGDPLGRGGSWLVGSDFTYQTSRFRGDKNLRLGVWGLARGRDSLTGDRTAVGAGAEYPNDLWDLSAAYKRIGDAFDPPLGFVPRTGGHMANRSFVWRPRPAHPIGPLHIRQCFWENELSFVAGLTGGWQSYRYFMAPINCRLESGDRFEFNIIPTGERLTEPFALPDSVTVPPGAYHFFRFRLEAGLA